MSRDTEHRHNFLNIWTIFTKFSTNIASAQMQHIYDFEGSLSILSLLFLRLNTNGHLQLSDFCQSWWVVIYSITQ